jgi:signal transduction histidine kinase
LGLRISKAIAEAHGGSLVADSALGIGLRFIVSIPISAQQVSQICR